MERDPVEICAERIKKFMAARGDTFETLADAIGSSRSTLNDQVRKGNLGVRELHALAKLFECSTDYLLGVMPELKGSHYVIDLDAERLALQKRDPPSGRWAWPIPQRFEVVDALRFLDREAAVLGKKGRGKS